MIGSTLIQSVSRRFANLLDATTNASNGAGQVGFLYSLAYAGNTVGAWLKALATSAGATFIGFIAAGVGAILRTLQSKLREQVSVLDYGADPTGVADSSAAFNAALTAAGFVWIPDGTYKLMSTVTIASNKLLEASAGATINAGTAGMTVFQSTTSAYFSQLWNIVVNGNSLATVTAYDFTNMRLGAGVFNCGATKVNIGLILRTGCFGTQVLNFNTYQTPNGIQVLANCSVVDIHHPTLDNETGNGGTGIGIGISIAAGAGTNIGVNVRGGFIQGFDTGVTDGALASKVESVYFELCTTADIYGNACRSPSYKGCVHFGPSGAAAYKMRSTDSGFVGEYDVASGARTVVFDVDSSNTNFVQWAPLSAASMNSPLGTTTYMGQLPIETVGTFLPVIAGSATAGVAATYPVQAGKWNKRGNTARAEFTVQCTGHNGTGNVTVTGIPAGLAPASFTISRVFKLAVNGLPFTGPAIYASFSGAGTVITLYQITTAGVVALIAMQPGMTLNVTAEWEIN